MLTTNPNPPQYIVQARNGLRVREQPGRAGRTLGHLPHGILVTATGRQEAGWQPIAYNRDVGYVSFRYLLPAGGGDAPRVPFFAFASWPTSEYRFTQRFGVRPEYYARYHLPGHDGVDIAAPIDTPIFAVAAGKILYLSASRRDGRPSPYGWHLELDHGGGWRTLYAHLAPTIPVQAGERVEAGQIIGTSGNTGDAYAPHLHLTLRSPTGRIGWPAKITDPTPFLLPLLAEKVVGSRK